VASIICAFGAKRIVQFQLHWKNYTGFCANDYCIISCTKWQDWLLLYKKRCPFGTCNNSLSNNLKILQPLLLQESFHEINLRSKKCKEKNVKKKSLHFFLYIFSAKISLVFGRC